MQQNQNCTRETDEWTTRDKLTLLKEEMPSQLNCSWARYPSRAQSASLECCSRGGDVRKHNNEEQEKASRCSIVIDLRCLQMFEHIAAWVTFLHAVDGSYSPCGVQKQLHLQGFYNEAS